MTIQIQVDKNINMAVLGDREDEGYYDEDERIAQKLIQPKAECDEEALGQWLQWVYPRLGQILDLNARSRTFDNYDVFWDEERSEIELWHKLKTNYDFNEANKATQKALSQMKASAVDSSMSTAKDDDDDWGNGAPSSSAASDAG